MLNPIVVSWRIYPKTTGGIEVFNYHFVKWLAGQNGVQPTLITTKAATAPQGVHTRQYNTNLRRLGNVATVLAFFRGCLSAGKGDKVVFLSYSRSSWKIWAGYFLAASFLKIPYVIYIHGGGMYPWKHPAIMKKVFEKATSVFCVSPLQKKEYERRTDASIEVLAPLVPFEKFSGSHAFLRNSYGIKENDFVFLYLGSLRAVKGTDVLMEAFMDLGEFATRNNIHLLVVGAGNTEHYKAMLEGASCADNVHFTGKVRNEIVGNFYAVSDCFVLPSRMEGMPIALIQALSNKLPVVVSDLPTIPKILSSGENCIKFPPEDSQALSQSMKYIYADELERKKIAESGYRLYRDNWESGNTFQTLLDALKKASESDSNS